MVIHQSWTWKPLNQDIEARIESCQKSWEGTPYRKGQRAKQMGVDCVQLTVAMLDELYRRSPTKIPRTIGTIGQTLAIRRAFPVERVRDQTIEPGDVILIRSHGGVGTNRVVGHVLSAGILPQSAIHAVHLGNVSMTTLIYEILKVYRPMLKESWM